MVHADASNFAAGITKAEAYRQVLEQAKSLFEGQRNWVCNLANTASLLWHLYHSLPHPSDRVNWAGFYVVAPTDTTNETTTPDREMDRDPRKKSWESRHLILGPFMGKVACQTIAPGRGVCGLAAAEGRTVRVEEVDSFPGHIACDGESRSEVVVPVRQGDEVVAIIDVDCAVVAGFDEEDQRYLEELADLLAASCDF